MTKKTPELVDFVCDYVSAAGKACTDHIKALPSAKVGHQCIDKKWKLLKVRDAT